MALFFIKTILISLSYITYHTTTKNSTNALQIQEINLYHYLIYLLNKIIIDLGFKVKNNPSLIFWLEMNVVSFIDWFFLAVNPNKINLPHNTFNWLA